MGNTLVGEGACPGFRKVNYRVDDAVLDKINEIAQSETESRRDEIQPSLRERAGV